MACACTDRGRLRAAPKRPCPGSRPSASPSTPARVEAGGPIDCCPTRFTVAATRRALRRRLRGCSSTRSMTSNELLWTDDHAPPTPTQNWKPGETVDYTRTMFVPRSSAHGRRSAFEVGLFSRASGERLPLAGADRGHAVVRGRHACRGRAEPTRVVVQGRLARRRNGRRPGHGVAVVAPEGRLSFRNPKRASTLYPAARTNQSRPFRASQAVEVAVRAESSTPSSWRRVRPSWPHPALGRPAGCGRHGRSDDRGGPDVRAGGTAQLKSTDTRELGIRLLNAFVGPSETAASLGGAVLLARPFGRVVRRTP